MSTPASFSISNRFGEPRYTRRQIMLAAKNTCRSGRADLGIADQLAPPTATHYRGHLCAEVERNVEIKRRDAREKARNLALNFAREADLGGGKEEFS